ncbi:MAG: hypothetical protein AUG13_06670 [Chloroflexi bacterium 13_1_20CM_2_59_7]|nr:MAG: hypothetical protein AUG13_06670 [Chloroflexi bacterium 13_1_20CM_2_59_7]
MQIFRNKSGSGLWLSVVMLLGWGGSAWAQSCLAAGDMDEASRAALVNTAKRYFDMAARGDSAALRQNAIASVASDFSGIETAVKDNQANFAGAQATPRPPFLLQAEGPAPPERAEFLCGVFGKSGQTPDSAVFVIPNLPPGNYALTTLDVTGSKGNFTLSFVLQQQGTNWKLGGFYAKPAQIAGHDGNWFAGRAREFKAKGQTHNAWLYYLEARELLVPVPFMSTMMTDKLYDESQSVKPADLPPLNLTAGSRTFKVTQLFPLPVGQNLDLVVKYESADVSNSAQTFQDNTTVMKALLAKYPEFRDAFDGVVARAVEPSGRDYGSLLAMKDIK